MRPTVPSAACGTIPARTSRRARLGGGLYRRRELRRIAPDQALERIHLYLDFATGRIGDVPDPYYGGPEGFADVYRMIREASEALAGKAAWRESTSGHASSTM